MARRAARQHSSGSVAFDNEIFERALEECVKSKLRVRRNADAETVFREWTRSITRMWWRDSQIGKWRFKKMKEKDDDDDDDDANKTSADMETMSVEIARNLYDVISNVPANFEDYDPESNKATTATATNLTSKRAILPRLDCRRRFGQSRCRI